MINQVASINTAEGWNQRAESANRSAFVDAFGREPANKGEVSAWIMGLLHACDPIKARVSEQRLSIIDGEAFWVQRLSL